MKNKSAKPKKHRAPLLWACCLLMAAQYIGRFAPSPSGPLHFGSLITAVGSYLDAKANGGNWLVRIEDLDPPRCIQGAGKIVLAQLEAYGFEWDGEVLYQSDRLEIYRDAIGTLQQQSLIYPCTCTRKALLERCELGAFGTIYDRHCSARPISTAKGASLRMRILDDTLIGIDDAIQGQYKQNLNREVGDFHVKRRDGLFAYHIGVAVDDHLQGITHIVRGCDLLDSSPSQVYIQQRLGVNTPSYAHLPLALKPNGQKLSKQNLAPALFDQEAKHNIVLALSFLNQDPPADIQHRPLEEIWQWAISNWCLNSVPKTSGMFTPESVLC